MKQTKMTKPMLVSKLIELSKTTDYVFFTKKVMLITLLGMRVSLIKLLWSLVYTTTQKVVGCNTTQKILLGIINLIKLKQYLLKTCLVLNMVLRCEFDEG